MIKKEILRETAFGDFRISLIRFEAGGARISIGPKEPTKLVDNFLFTPSFTHSNFPSNSPWIDFYSTKAGTFEAQILAQSGRNEDISKYTAAHGPPDYTIARTLFSGGELLIPLNKELIFWVKIPARYSTLYSNVRGNVGNPSFNGSSVDTDDFSNNMQIEWGENVPKTEILSSDEIDYYLIYVPFCKMKITQTSFDLTRYDFGECVYMSVGFLEDGDYLDFGKVSSFFD